MTLPEVTIYTDGGASPNPGVGSYGIQLNFVDKYDLPHCKEKSGVIPRATNNEMELISAIVALQSLKVPCSVNLYSDSQYLVQGMTEWMPGWLSNGWRTSTRKPVANQALWMRLLSLTKIHKVEFIWVKGHAGDATNNRVDELVNLARAELNNPAKSWWAHHESSCVWFGEYEDGSFDQALCVELSIEEAIALQKQGYETY